MDRRLPRPIAAALLCTLAVCASAARAQPGVGSALINQALDAPVKLELDTTLPQAIAAIADQTGVRIEADRAVWELLPWGDQTSIQLKTDGGTLRAAMTTMARKLGLTATIKEQAVELTPMPALRRLGRRATLDELRALDLLASTPAEFGPPPMKVKDLLAAVDKRLADAKADFAVENRAGPDVAGRAVDYPRNATLMDALEAVVAQTEATWYPWGKSLVALPKDDQVRNQLAKTVNKRYNGVNVAQVLLELSQEAGVEFTIEPGAIQRLPPEARNVRMLLDNASVQQALEYIAGFTGLAYQVNDRGVAVWNPNTLPGTGGSARDPVVAILPLDGGGELLIQASQLPPDVRDYLRARVGRQVDRLREQMRVEGFKPSTANTQPATTPATQATP